MYFSVTSENCRTSPVLRSVFDRRIVLMKPPNSAPIVSSGTESRLIVSMGMPSSPIRVTARVPSTRSRMPSSTDLNTPLLPLPLGHPLLESCHLRILRLCRGRRGRGSGERRELVAHVAIVRVAVQDLFIDVPRLIGKPLLHVQIGHRERSREIACRFDRGEDIRCRLFVLHRSGNLGGLRSGNDVHAWRTLYVERRSGVLRSDVFERTGGVS